MTDNYKDRFDKMQSFFIQERLLKVKNSNELYSRFLEELKTALNGHDHTFCDFIELASKNINGNKNKTNSVLCYVLGITSVLPDEKTSLNHYKVYQLARAESPPDIDCDFENKEPIFQHMREKYGENNCALICTYALCKAKKAIQSAFKIKGITIGDMDVNKTAIFISKKVFNADTFDESIANPELKEYVEKFKDVFELARTISGIKLNTSVHAAGIIASDIPLSECVPLKRTKDGLVSEYDKEDVENIGLLKNDILVVSTLQHIHKTIDMIKDKTGDIVDLSKIDLNDKNILKLYKDIDTSGVFQMEQYTLRKVLESVDVTSFDDIVACNALGRPGPIMEGYPQQYGQRQKNHHLIQYYHPSLKEVLKNTYGLIIYQEQVMKITKILAGFTPNQADKIRKFIGKKQNDESKVKPIRDLFINGCKRVGLVDEAFAENMWRIMEGFGSYAFNKSHSVAYSMLSMWTAYLKTYYYPYFMSCLLSTTLEDGQPSSEEKIKIYYSELKKRGYSVKSPDINLSKDYFDVCGNQIVQPFHVLKGIGKAIGTSLSKMQPFKDFEDFLNKTQEIRIGSDVITLMIENGYFKSFNSKDNFQEQYNIFSQNRKRDKGGLKPLTGKIQTKNLGTSMSYPDISKLSKKNSIPKIQKTLL